MVISNTISCVIWNQRSHTPREHSPFVCVSILETRPKVFINVDFFIAHLVVKIFWMDKKIPIESILPYDDPCVDCQTKEPTENYEFRHNLIIRFAFSSFFLIFLGLLLYEILLVPKGYFKGDPWNGKVSADNPCLMENGKHLRLRLIKDFKSIKNCFN